MKNRKPSTKKPVTKPRVKESAAIYRATLKTNAAPAVQELAEKFGLRQETVSRLTGFSLRAVAGWASGKQASPPVKRAFTEMDRLLDGLSRLMKPREVGHWLKESNPAFDGSTPVQVIERGQVDRVWRMLYFIESGDPG